MATKSVDAVPIHLTIWPAEVEVMNLTWAWRTMGGADLVTSPATIAPMFGFGTSLFPLPQKATLHRHFPFVFDY
jgi:hypothetical protein